MIAWLLAQLEQNPATVFYEADLVERFSDGFEQAKAQRLLRHVPRGRSFSRGVESPHLVFEADGGQLEAFDAEDPEGTVLTLEPEDLNRWRLDLLALASRIQHANDLRGSPELLSGQLCFLGERELDGTACGFVLALLNKRTALSTLRQLPALLPRERYHRVIVVCPTYTPPPTARREIESMDLSLVPLVEGDSLAVELTPAEPRDDEAAFRQWNDYRTVKCRGRRYSLNGRQAAVVRLLHHAHNVDRPEVPWKEITDVLDGMNYYPARMRDVFRRVEGWQALIIRTRPGFWRLNL